MTGAPLSAVKYYQREGLLPQGDKSAPNQVQYDDSHVQRIRLIRALMGAGGLSLAATRNVIAAIEAEGSPIASTFEVAQHAMAAPRAGESDPSPESVDRVLELIRARGWRAGADNPGVAAAARAIDGLRTVDLPALDDYLDGYAGAAETAAVADLDALSRLEDPERIAEVMVVGSVLGDPLFAGLRRIAQQHATQNVFPTE